MPSPSATTADPACLIRLLRCPLCGGAFALAGASLHCASGHAFDLAREGYVNLLGKPLPGDATEMVRARRGFLGRGYYRSLLEALAAQAGVHLAAIGGGAVLDAGCGEGYYLGGLSALLPPGAANCRLGLDVSRDAIRRAARRYPGASWVVADMRARLPFPDGAFAVLLDVFAPRNPAEFARVLASGGLLLDAAPGPAHLAELRAALPLLGIEPEKQAHIVARFAGAFTPLETIALDYEVTLPPDAVAEPLTMSPAYRHRDRRPAPAIGPDPVPTTVSFVVQAFRREPGTAV